MKIRRSLIVVGLSVVAATSAFAHHSFSAQFDVNKPTTVMGSVTKLDWMNPHAHLFIEVTGANGTVTNWEIELGPPTVLMRNGLNKNSLKAGDIVTVNGSRAKDGANLVNARSVTLADGSVFSAGPPAEFSPLVR